MEVTLTLALPQDHLSVPLARRILSRSLNSLGIDRDAVSDIELALTEACTNVLDHARGDDDYVVSAGIDGRMCVIEVIDRGTGFDGSLHGLADAAHSAEEGRGVQLMRALMDHLEFQSRPITGTVVHLEKRLTWPADSPIARLDPEVATPR
ncbi:MAG: serine/threonine-protein kinase RsbW [Frankiales bacterium]|jgi:serine/threonine-protein kinase RsbW|nr:serine/threonine-protein kinase RsbW [Frankiales bacterium]